MNPHPPTRRGFVFARLAPFILLLLAAWTPPAAAQAEAEPQGKCVTCINSMTCSATTQPGVWASSCTVTSSGECQESFSICFISERNAAAELDVGAGDFLRVATAEGALPLAPVGQSRFAAWNCRGELIYLAARRSDGTLRRLPLEPFRERYAYARLAAAARRRAAA